jgi:hypothetical protein
MFLRVLSALLNGARLLIGRHLAFCNPKADIASAEAAFGCMAPR